MALSELGVILSVLCVEPKYFFHAENAEMFAEIAEPNMTFEVKRPDVRDHVKL